jgi:hypothetical protein
MVTREKRAPRKAKRTETQTTGEGKVTWLTPFAGAWDAKFGAGAFPFGQAAKALQALKDRPPSEKADRLKRYLAETEARFVSLPRFAATYEAWTAPPAEDYTVFDEWMPKALDLATRPKGMS